MAEINLMKNYPKTARDVNARLDEKTEEHRIVARQFGKDFFDGSRNTGYGGFDYNPRFWQPVVPDFIAHFDIKASDSLLDVGCAKGFMLADFKNAIPGLTVKGIDISAYAIENGHPAVAGDLLVGDCAELPFEDSSFDFVISVTTIHNHDYETCKKALSEIQRVSKKGAFITVDAYRNEAEKRAMHAWNLTAKTILHVDEWRTLFSEVGYQGDYYWFMP